MCQLHVRLLSLIFFCTFPFHFQESKVAKKKAKKCSRKRQVSDSSDGSGDEGAFDEDRAMSVLAKKIKNKLVNNKLPQPLEDSLSETDEPKPETSAATPTRTAIREDAASNHRASESREAEVETTSDTTTAVASSTTSGKDAISDHITPEAPAVEPTPETSVVTSARADAAEDGLTSEASESQAVFQGEGDSQQVESVVSNAESVSAKDDADVGTPSGTDSNDVGTKEASQAVRELPELGPIDDILKEPEVNVDSDFEIDDQAVPDLAAAVEMLDKAETSTASGGLAPLATDSDFDFEE